MKYFKQIDRHESYEIEWTGTNEAVVELTLWDDEYDKTIKLKGLMEVVDDA